MEEKTLKALVGSCKKWLDIARGKGVDESAENCPLCKMFLAHDDCDGCPIFEHTGRRTCKKTPYWNWIDHQKKVHNSNSALVVLCPKCASLAWREFMSLANLLPIDKRKGILIDLLLK